MWWRGVYGGEVDVAGGVAAATTIVTPHPARDLSTHPPLVENQGHAWFYFHLDLIQLYPHSSNNFTLKINLNKDPLTTNILHNHHPSDKTIPLRESLVTTPSSATHFRR